MSGWRYPAPRWEIGSVAAALPNAAGAGNRAFLFQAWYKSHPRAGRTCHIPPRVEWLGRRIADLGSRPGLDMAGQAGRGADVAPLSPLVATSWGRNRDAPGQAVANFLPCHGAGQANSKTQGQNPPEGQCQARHRLNLGRPHRWGYMNPM